MDGFCAFVLGIVLLYIFIRIGRAIGDANEKRAQEEAIAANERQAQWRSVKNQLDSLWDRLKTQNSLYASTIVKFFSMGIVVDRNGNHVSNYSYASKHKELQNIVTSMRATVGEMAKTHDTLKQYGPHDTQTVEHINDGKAMILRAESTVAKFMVFGEKVYKLPASKMIDMQHYGRINSDYRETVRNMQRNDVENTISRYSDIINSNSFDELFAIDLEKVLRCVWYFALDEKYSADLFHRAENIFYRIYKLEHPDPVLAGYYAKNRVGGEDVLRESVHTLLKNAPAYFDLTGIASGLMWMNAYQSERMVLEHILTSGKRMPDKAQERLHALKNGGGNAPSGFDGKRSSADTLYFDVSALAWKDEEYIGLFENLAFKDKKLTYSLALRDEDKELFIPQGINVPNTAVVVNKLQQVFVEEYGQGVAAQAANCIALSGAGEEKMDGILVTANENRQMGVLLHIARIGKKLIIKFYTLFMPTGTDLAVQKQQALSMHKKLSPTVAMWESSLKDTMLMAVEQLLNTNAQTSPAPTNGGASTEEPIF